MNNHRIIFGSLFVNVSGLVYICQTLNLIKNLKKLFQSVVRDYPPNEIAGIGFDATCSLVCIDEYENPLSISPTGLDEQNIILWMDHRASNETDFINSTKHDILKYIGGKVSIEMQIPKLLWLKKHLNISCWKNAAHFFDLPDFLTWKCTGIPVRSLCSVVCKWNYDAIENSWPENFFDQIGLEDLKNCNYKKIGSVILPPGTTIGTGLTELAAKELGLPVNLPVGASIIDAHAGAVALLGCSGVGIDDNVISKMGIICGTSSCHMSVFDTPVWANGFWGPYKNALLPDMYLTEAGQSATGILVEYILKTHPAYDLTVRNADEKKINLYIYLNKLLESMAVKNKLKNFQELTRSVHSWPDFHGNRTPIADPNLRGMFSGLSMITDEENMATMYLAIIQSLAVKQQKIILKNKIKTNSFLKFQYGTRHIIESLIKNGRPAFKSILLCGGLSKNELFVQTHADVCLIPVLLPQEPEAVLLGASMLGACAAKVFPDLQSAMMAMGGNANIVTPNPNCVEYHKKKYDVFLKMLADQRSYENIMKG